MARPSPVVAAFALLAALAAPASAQGLRTLHVQAISMRTDRTTIAVGATFHVAIHVHVRERIANLDELVVPDIGTMLPMGDERTVSHAGGGTDVVETLTLSPTVAGPFTFGRAYFDAIDALTGRPSRFWSNPLRVVVVAAAGSASSALGATAAALRETLNVVAVVVGLLILLLVGVAVVRIGRARRRVSVTVAAPEPLVPPTPTPPPRTPRDEVATALRRYRTAPANGALRDLRAALFAAAGATPGATLRDALARAPDGALRAALQAADEAAFGPAAARDAASAELVDAAQRWLR